MQTRIDCATFTGKLRVSTKVVDLFDQNLNKFRATLIIEFEWI